MYKPLPDGITIKESNVQGLGVFATKDFDADVVLGIVHILNKNFPASFSMYDPIAKILPLYGWIYPIIETLLGLFFLLRYQLLLSLITTITLLGITTIGVTRSLLKKSDIQCACLGTALKLPMTKATFIENFIMIIMAVWMIISSNFI